MLNTAIVNVNNLIYNVKQIRTRLNTGVKFCAVVKADAYGHGASACANAIYSLVDVFAVALVEEGISLRNSGIKKDILVLIAPSKSDLPRAIEFGLTLTVDSLKQLKAINKQCAIQNKKAKVHIKYDTGMNRQGVRTLTELKEILDYANGKRYIEIDGLYSHLANSENARDTKKAVDKFLLAIKIVKGYNNKVICHISASGGFLQGFQFDMVRVGILMYGYKPFKTNVISVKPVMRVYAPVLRRDEVGFGKRVLYGGKRQILRHKTCLVRYGYADGLFRKKRGWQINNMCMDICCIKHSSKANKVCIMSNAESLAKKYNTISYEVLTKCALRAEKFYIR